MMEQMRKRSCTVSMLQLARRDLLLLSWWRGSLMQVQIFGDAWVWQLVTSYCHYTAEWPLLPASTDKIIFLLDEWTHLFCKTSLGKKTPLLLHSIRRLVWGPRTVQLLHYFWKSHLHVVCCFVFFIYGEFRELTLGRQAWWQVTFHKYLWTCHLFYVYASQCI